MKTKYLLPVLFGILCTAMVACSGGGSSVDEPPPPISNTGGGGGTPTPVPTSPVASIDVTPANLTPTLSIGQTAPTVTVQARDAAGDVVSGATYVWTSSDSSVAEVNSLGVVTAKSQGGPVTISVTSGGETVAVMTVIVTCAGSPSNAPTPPALTLDPASPLSVKATTALSVIVRDCNGNPVPDNTLVTFSMTPDTLGTLSATSASTVSGVANVTFTAGATAGNVTLTATSGSASGSSLLTLLALPAGSIQFQQAVPQRIGVKQSGQNEVSEVSFLVEDIQGEPVADGSVTVKFQFLSGQNPGGGASIDPPAVSTLAGVAKTFLKSGLVAGPVRIVAFIDTNGNDLRDAGEIASTTTALSIGGGVPSMRHFSVSASVHNIAGLAYDGLTSTVSIRLADRFSNTDILQGTSISFYTEAGAIPSQALTDAAGVASVDLRSQDPRPIDTDPRQALNPISGDALFHDLNVNADYDPFEPNPRDGLLSVVAATQGEETFYDGNGNGVYDTGEAFDDNGGEPYIDENDNGMYDDIEAFDDPNSNDSYEPGEPFYDKGRGEPYYDANNNGIREAGEPFTDLDGDSLYDAPGDAFWDADHDGAYDLGEPTREVNGVAGFQSGGFHDHIYNRGEFYVDVNQDGQWTHGDGKWNENTTIWVSNRGQFSSQRMVFTGGPDFSWPTRIDPTYAPILNGGCQNFAIFIADHNNNMLVPGTKATVKLDGAGKLIGRKERIIGDNSGGGPDSFVVTVCDPDPATTKVESFSLEVEIVWAPPGVAEFKDSMFATGTTE